MWMARGSDRWCSTVVTANARYLGVRSSANDRDRPAPASLDATSLSAAYVQHSGAAYRVAYGILGDHPSAEDVVQDAFLKLWTGTAQFDPTRGPVIGLLLTIARNKAIDRMRNVARRQRIEGLCVPEEVVHGPEGEVERADDARNLRRAILRLPKVQRQVIEMAHFGGLTCREIASEMDVPAGTVKSRMRLGMRKLAITLGSDPDVSETAGSRS